ncbi:MAG TPA: YqiA/YcfP family alpha/beta fold hydrolase, partial [Sulfuricurvum sp.]|nr:YqiA/YcfP family alpha/beta fold hydrolase [Sulfuricurvum sp.]
KFEVHHPNPDHYLLLLQKGDEVLDYTEALAKLPDASTIVEEGGNHSFIGIEHHVKTIKDFFYGDR